MLTASKIQAVSLALTDGGEAVLVQDGPEWNGLRRFRCIAPASLESDSIIATADKGNSPMAKLFGEIFDLGPTERWVLVMVTPALLERLKR